MGEPDRRRALGTSGRRGAFGGVGEASRVQRPRPAIHQGRPRISARGRSIVGPPMTPPMTPFNDGWLAKYQSLVNDDPEMHVIGDWFTVTFSLTSGDDRAIVRFERGRLASYVVSPRFDAACAFGFRASPEIW